MKNLLIILFCCVLTTTSAFAKCNCKPTCNCVSKKVVYDELKFYKNYAESVKKERAAVSNALQLTEEQAQCRNELMRENTVLLEQNYKKLYKETKQLNELKESVFHCDQVLKQNKDRYPVLEKANKLLTKTYDRLMADIENVKTAIAWYDENEG